MDWHAISETGNVLSIIGILVSALGVLVSVLYARSAKKAAKGALQAATTARREVLIRLASEDSKEMLEQAASMGHAIQKGDIPLAHRIASDLNKALATAKTSWPDILKETQHAEIALALRENQRILRLLRDDSVAAQDRIEQGAEMVDLLSQWLGQLLGRLRFRS